MFSIFPLLLLFHILSVPLLSSKFFLSIENGCLNNVRNSIQKQRVKRAEYDGRKGSESMRVDNIFIQRANLVCELLYFIVHINATVSVCMCACVHVSMCIHISQLLKLNAAIFADNNGCY